MKFCGFLVQLIFSIGFSSFLIAACSSGPTQEEIDLANREAAGKRQQAEFQEHFAKRKAEYLEANAKSGATELLELCKLGGVWGNFIQSKKIKSDSWAKSSLKGNFRTKHECDVAREKRPDKDLVMNCEVIKDPPPRYMKAVQAKYESSMGKHFSVLFSNMEKCQMALKDGLDLYRPPTENEKDRLFRVERGGYGMDGFDGTCESTQIDVCSFRADTELQN